MSTTQIITFALVIIVPFVILRYVDRHNKRHGSLFSGKPTPLTRIISLILALGTGFLSYKEFTQGDRVYLLWIALTIVLISYAIGIRSLMDLVQNNQNSRHPHQD